MNILAIIFWAVVLGLGLSLIFLMGLDKIFKFKWTCRVFGWHDGAGNGTHSFDGCSVRAVCSKCGKKVMKDSQGNWF